MPGVSMTLVIEADNLTDLADQIDAAAEAFRASTPEAAAPTRTRGRRAGAVPATAHSGAADHLPQSDPATDAALDAGDLGDGGDGSQGALDAGDGLNGAGGRDAKPARRSKASAMAAGPGAGVGENDASPTGGAGGEAPPVEEGAGGATLAEIQALAKTLGATEGKGVAAVQRVFSEQHVRTPKDIDPAKLEALKAAFEQELAA